MSFTNYMMEFYGPNGIYPMALDQYQITIATQIYKTRLARDNSEFYGDSLDRERVRDIITEARAVVLPEFAGG